MERVRHNVATVGAAHLEGRRCNDAPPGLRSQIPSTSLLLSTHFHADPTLEPFLSPSRISEKTGRSMFSSTPGESRECTPPTRTPKSHIYFTLVLYCKHLGTRDSLGNTCKLFNAQCSLKTSSCHWPSKKKKKPQNWSQFLRWPERPRKKWVNTCIALAAVLANAISECVGVLAVTSHSWLILSLQSTKPPRSFLRELLSSSACPPPPSTYVIDFVLT